MTPSVPLLLSWQPAVLAAAGEQLASQADSLQRAAGDPTGVTVGRE